MLEPVYQALIAQKQYTFLIRNEVFQNPGTLRRWKGNEIMRQCVKAIGNLPWKEQERGTVALIRRDFSEQLR
ncbi:hypothetical protein C8R21_12934 [Nitrosospira multiformis]|jgi:hypothetical protein|uniref:Uncharacterized protein n=1 Tax=Nitrosospira multiformis TaxID=1231 RepID=A0A2T5I6D0_9PROT|nr:hypothetical protein C8R21_12934 [Nitrosospira multiformis]